MRAESPLGRVARAAGTIASAARDPRIDLRLLRLGLRDRGDERRTEVVSRVLDAYSAAVRDRASADEPYRLGWQYADADAR
ncbi:MAG: hypothetical protein ACRDLK_09020, partial [Gaiellaceae bacterium]